jgi:hypothetical protein
MLHRFFDIQETCNFSLVCTLYQSIQSFKLQILSDWTLYIYIFRLSDGPVVWGPPAAAVVAIDLDRLWSLLRTVWSTRRRTILMLGDGLSSVKPRHERP